MIEGARFLDLFAGSGAMGFEALSRGAEFAVFIDSGKSSVRCIRENVIALGVEDRTSILSGDALKLLQQLDKRHEAFNLIYIDPPYDIEDREVYAKILKRLDGVEFLKLDGRVFVEAEQKRQIELPLEGYKNLKFRQKRRYGIAELFEFKF